MQYLVLTDPQNPSGEKLSLEQIKQAVASGTIGEQTQMWYQDQAKWIELRHHPDLQGVFAQSLWDAWEEANDAEFAAIGTFPAKTTKKSSSAASEESSPEEISKPDAPVDELRTKRATAVQSMETTPQPFVDSARAVSPAESPPTIELIPLEEPSDQEPSDQELPMLEDELLLSLQELSPKPPIQKRPKRTVPQKISTLKPSPPRNFNISESNFSLTRVLVPIILGGCIIWLARGYINSEAMSSYKPPSKPKIEQSKTIENWEIEKKLRSSLSEDIIPLVPDASFEDILQVELARFRIQSLQMKAKVTKWTGRKEDRPQKAKVQLTIEGTGEMDYDIAAVALVLGKYMEQYFMDVEELELCLDSNEDYMLCAKLDAEIAREFYLQRVSYAKLFEKIII